MEGKKSFVLYADLLEIVEVLTDEQAGLLFKTVLRYVNDKDPEIPREIQLAFIPIKQSLKRDLEKWKDIRVKRAEAGRKGGLATQNKEKQEEANQANACFDKQNQANQAVNVNVNDNVNVNVNGNDIDSIIKPSDAPKAVKPKKHKYGQYGWILLTDEQYNKLKSEYPNIDTYINNLDEYIQSTGNKNKYKDFNLVLRKSIRENWSIHNRSTFTSINKTPIVWESATPYDVNEGWKEANPESKEMPF